MGLATTFRLQNHLVIVPRPNSMQILQGLPRSRAETQSYSNPTVTHSLQDLTIRVNQL